MRNSIVAFLMRLWDNDGSRAASQNQRLEGSKALRERGKTVTNRSTRVAEVIGSYLDTGDILTR